MFVSMNKVGLFVLFCFEAIVFYAQMHDQIAPYYPTGFDQLSYLSESYKLVDALHSLTWPVAWTFEGSAPQGLTFPLQGAFLALVGGANRTSLMSINLVYFLMLQVMVFFTVFRRTSRSYLAWVSVALVVSLGAIFPVSGGILDYRLDFAAMCLYGIWICAILNSRFFADRKWSIIVGVLGVLLVSMRFITLTYVGGVLLILFCVLAVKRRDFVRLINCFISGIIILAVTAPMLFLAREAMFRYYVVGHATGDEKNIRAAEAGVKSLFDAMLYYPDNILTVQLGQAFIMIACLIVIASLIFGSNRWAQFRTHTSDVLVLCTAIIVPLVILFFDVGKSPVVGGVVSVPLILIVIMLATAKTTRLVGVTLASFASVVAVMAFISHANTVQHYLTDTDMRTVNRLTQAMADHLEKTGNNSPLIAFDRVEDYMNAGILPISRWEGPDAKTTPALNVGTTMGAIFAISSDDALSAVTKSDIVVISDQFKGREAPYPFNTSMKQIWPVIADYAKENMTEIASGRVGEIPYKVYAR